MNARLLAAVALLSSFAAAQNGPYEIQKGSVGPIRTWMSREEVKALFPQAVEVPGQDRFQCDHPKCEWRDSLEIHLNGSPAPSIVAYLNDGGGGVNEIRVYDPSILVAGTRLGVGATYADVKNALPSELAAPIAEAVGVEDAARTLWFSMSLWRWQPGQRWDQGTIPDDATVRSISVYAEFGRGGR